MSLLPSILAFVFLFFALCALVILGMTLWNIFQKSYKPQNSLIFVLLMLFFFFSNSILAFNSLRIFLTTIDSNISNSIRNNTPQF